MGQFDYKMLMKNKDINMKLDCELIKLYEELDLGKYYIINMADCGDNNNLWNTYKDIKNQLLAINDDIYEVVDILVEYLYNRKKSNYKLTLWECFGDVMIENLKENITQPLGDEWIQCEVCGERIKYYNNRKYCDKCQIEVDRKKARIRMNKIRKSVRS